MCRFVGVVLLILATVLAGCGGSPSTGASLGANTTTLAPTSFTVGGQIDGLSAGSITLQLNGGNALTLTGNGQFTFAPSLSTGTVYTATISSPTSSLISCTINNDTGTIANQNLRSITVTCGCSVSISSPVTITGTVTYDHVPHNTTTNGLDYSAIPQSPARGVNVQAIDSSGALLNCVNTLSDGTYSIPVPRNTTNMKIRVLAEMVKKSTSATDPSWAYRVVDNTNSDAQWAMQSMAFSTTTSNITGKDLNATSGWTGTSYDPTTRIAAPFAILDDIYTATAMISAAAIATTTNASFPGLTLNWSPTNKAVTGLLSAGDITTTHYSNSNIYILGYADNDTDEYDDHVVIHEFGHYFEDLFSRADSLGGAHSSGDYLDMRVAFSEGWGNAFSAMATHDQYYRDSIGISQSDGFGFDLESNTITNPGWFSEGSVQSILYDLFDSASDSPDNISFDFTPIYSTLINQQRTTPAFTSLFSFITALKANNSSSSTAIDALVTNQNVITITDAYDSSEVPSTGLTNYYLPVYSTVTIGGSTVNLCTTEAYDTAPDSNGNREGNKLGEWRYLRLQVGSAGNHTISVSGDNLADPDIYLYQNGHLVAYAENYATSDSLKYNFTAGEYLIDVVDYNLLAGTPTQPARTGPSCFSISVSN